MIDIVQAPPLSFQLRILDAGAGASA